MDPSRTGTMLTIRFITARRLITHVYTPQADHARYQSHGSLPTMRPRLRYASSQPRDPQRPCTPHMPIMPESKP
eukprot:7142342-Heterocapsa_arctica.AAC.1